MFDKIMSLLGVQSVHNFNSMAKSSISINHGINKTVFRWQRVGSTLQEKSDTADRKNRKNQK